MNQTDPRDDSRISPQEPKPYYYRTAGIFERPGHVPFWLLLVILGLFVWGGYYLIEFWGPP